MGNSLRSILRNWPKFVFLYLPLCIITIDAGVLIYEYLRPDSEKAVRLVRESISRKQGFTVQQLLYATVYHRKRSGESIEIEGWRVERSAESKASFMVQFSFANAAGRHVGIWSVDIATGSIAPQNDMASDLSWR
jgi:predicted nucleic acid-binding protein